MIYIDESGSIPKGDTVNPLNKFFIVTLIHTDDPEKLKRVFNNAMKSVKRKFSSELRNLKSGSNEIKGSDLSPVMKEYILKKLVNETDIEIYYMALFNELSSEKYKTNTTRTYNVLVKNIIENSNLSEKTKKLNILCDNRNVKVKGLKELEGLLDSVLRVESELFEEVKVEYVDSEKVRNIQVADIISNTIFRYYTFEGYLDPELRTMKIKATESAVSLYNIIEPRISSSMRKPKNSNILIPDVTEHKTVDT